MPDAIGKAVRGGQVMGCLVGIKNGAVKVSPFLPKPFTRRDEAIDRLAGRQQVSVGGLAAPFVVCFVLCLC